MTQGSNESARQEAQRRFEHTLQELLPSLYRCARALCSNSADAEDLVHDACVKALSAHHAADLPDIGACNAWVRRILVNTYRDRYRRETKTPIRTLSTLRPTHGDNVIELAASSDPSPEDWAHYTDFDSAAQAAMASLPTEVRVVTTLFLVSGVSYKEIADVEGCPIGTVMSRLARGRRLLRTALGHFVGHPESSPSKSDTDNEASKQHRTS